MATKLNFNLVQIKYLLKSVCFLSKSVNLLFYKND